MAETLNLTDVLDHLDDEAGGEKLSVGQINSAFGGRGYGPILLAFALIEILPTGAIPGVPTLVGLLVVLVAGQLVAGRDSPWIPKKLADKGFSHDKFEQARDKIRPRTKKFDRLIRPRLQPLTTPLMSRAVGMVCVFLALTMPPLELVPFASSAPAVAIALLAIGLSAKDGLFILLGLIAATAAFGLGVYLLMG